MFPISKGVGPYEGKVSLKYLLELLWSRPVLHRCCEGCVQLKVWYFKESLK